jgi:hypothetical protein
MARDMTIDMRPNDVVVAGRAIAMRPFHPRHATILAPFSSVLITCNRVHPPRRTSTSSGSGEVMMPGRYSLAKIPHRGLTGEDDGSRNWRPGRYM